GLPEMVRVVIIGGGAAGMAVASRAKRLRKDYDVVVVERTRWVSFALCGLPYYVGCITKRLNDLLYYPIEEFTVKRGIKVLLETEAVSVDVSSRTITLRDLKSGREEELEWDYLVFATGAKSKAYKLFPEIKEFDNVYTLSHLDVAERLRSYLLGLREGAKVVLIGAGYVGLELAHTLTEAGYKVTIVEALDQVAPRIVDPDLAEVIRQELESHGVKVITSAPVREFKGSKGLAKSVVTDKGEIEGDAFVVGIGIEPNTDLAVKAGVKLGETGAIWTDEHMETNIKGVYAVGDAVEHTDLITGKRVWRPFAQIANKMGYVAGSVIGGREAIFRGSVGTSVFKTFNLVVARTGLSKKEAEKHGFKPIEASLEARTKAHYLPGGVRFKLKVIADEETGRLLGAQSVGPDDSVYWRINVIASLLTTGATVWDLFTSDIGYAPTVAPVWDALIIAARLLMRKLGEAPPKR
ncbi:MAG: FAD-dependent oxidoreductase, partial [Desulfurococcales archaeon]|nr:FAD-dependent oxidoreductase [Desulfurococcales archaeon]